MKIETFTHDMELKLGIKRYLVILLTVSIIVNMLLAVVIVSTKNTHRETLIPPKINQTFWIEDEKIAPNYLEEMAVFALQLALNNTPVSAKYNSLMLLKYIGPGSYGEMERSLMANAARMKKNSASTYFAIRTISISESENAVHASGTLTTYISDRKVNQEQKDYIVRFKFSGGRVYIYDLRETNSKKPFDDEIVKNPKVIDEDDEKYLKALEEQTNAEINTETEVKNEKN